MKRVLGVLVGVLLLAAACSSSALSKEEFLKQGNAICKKGNDEADAAFEKAFPDQNAQPDPATIAKLIKDTIAPNLTQQIDDIDALKPPKDLQSAADSLVTHARAALAKFQEQADKDPESLFSGSDPFADVNKEANDLGLTVCGQSE